jgi:hypothetical protein
MFTNVQIESVMVYVLKMHIVLQISVIYYSVKDQKKDVREIIIYDFKLNTLFSFVVIYILKDLL